MILKNLLIFIYINLSYQNLIKNGVYNLINKNAYLSYFKGKITVSLHFRYPYTFFRIKKIEEIINDTFYIIEETKTNNKLTYFENNILSLKRKNNLQFWKLIEINDGNDYLIQNTLNNCYVRVNNLEVFCDIMSPQKASEFKLIKIYNEIDKKNNTSNYRIINKQPIDVLIKYIDLNDPNLNRKGIHQIQKDYDNEELRYSIRSILRNIPWVRKIYILMPNERVRYFKEYNLIKNKIVYIKDKDFLGYESSNFNAFLFRYWKLKKYNVSQNLIIMDDDYFINNKLDKLDFFNYEDGKIVPLITSSKFVKIDRDFVEKNLKFFEPLAKSSKEEQNGIIFQYVKYLTFHFILNIFNISKGRNIYIPYFTHNAIPINLKDVKEIYDLVYMSKYKYTTLDCLYRHYEYIHFQILYISYTFLKYNRKVKNIPNTFIQINDSISANYNYFLFCINKGAGNFSFLNFNKAKIAMEYIFPQPSPYEIIDYSFLNLSFNVVYSMDKNIKGYEIQISHMITKKECFYLGIYFIIFFIIIFIKYNIYVMKKNIYYQYY